MADAIISVVAEQLIDIIKEPIQNEIHLVRGVEKEVENLSSELKKIRNVLDDAESRRFKDKNVNDWLSRLEHTSYEMEDVLDEWHYAILKHKTEHESQNAVVSPRKQKVCSFIPSSCFCFKKVAVRHDIAKKIKDVKEQLDQILKEKDLYNFVMSQPTTDPSSVQWRVQSTSFIDLEEVHGRDSDRDVLVSKLNVNGGSQEELGLQVLSIVGVGGLGKTTLAQLVYNDSRVKNYFELRIWICVSDPFDEVGIAKGIIESVKGSCPNTNNLEIVLRHLRNSISEKKFLLVLDDVWTDEYMKWEPLKNSLKCGATGSKILVTTRKETVAKVMGTKESEICRLGQLSDEDCWSLLCRMALFGRKEEEFEKFQDIGKKIAKKCKGLPLAAKTLGSLLSFKSGLDEWENVLDNEIWQLERAEMDLFPHLLLSYNELSPTLKRCFSYCAVLPKDSEIDVERLIGNWMALGYLGTSVGAAGDIGYRGRENFDILAMRSLFQDFKKSDEDRYIKGCKMHDIVHDFAKFLRKNDRVGAVGAKKIACQVCSHSVVSSVKEYRSMFWDNELPPNLCDCLKSLRVLGMTNCNLHGIPQGVEDLIHLRWLDLSDNSFSAEDLKTIFKLYNLQFLGLKRCVRQEIPWEIGNLIHLRHLDLSFNKRLKELPESICGLHELRTLNLDHCDSFSRLPQGIHGFVNLKHLFNRCTIYLKQFPQGLAQLTGLRTLSQFSGSRLSKMGWLKSLNRLTGSLELNISLSDDDDLVEDAREAELSKKIHIQGLEIWLEDEIDEKESSLRMCVLDALQPHPNLQNLKIWNYNGSKLPDWVASPLNQLRYIKLSRFNHMSSLPPLGQLPCLEQMYIDTMPALQYVGREFLGITAAKDTDTAESSSSSSAVAAGAAPDVAFPKLKELIFSDCYNWREWDDITAEEEESAAVSFMPCLAELTIQNCTSLRAPPRRLLRNVKSLELLDISDSAQLEQFFFDRVGTVWNFIGC